MVTTEDGPRPARWATLTLRWLAGLVLLVVLACGAIAVALQVTPMQTVTVAGQVIQVGATAPSLSLSGPGEIDLFGQSLPTNIQFTGPVRPRLQLSQISINSELTTFVEGTKAAGAERILGARLADGWKRYFAWETAVTGVGTLILVGALAGWRRVPHRTTIKLLAAGLLIAEALNVGAIMVTTYTAPALLRQVHSLSALVGSQDPPAADRPGRPAAAPGAGRGHRGLHRGRCRARPGAGPDRPCLRAQRRFLCGRPVQRQPVEGAQPRL